MRGMINGSEAMKILLNRQNLIEAAKVAPNFTEKLARYVKRVRDTYLTHFQTMERIGCNTISRGQGSRSEPRKVDRIRQTVERKFQLDQHPTLSAYLNLSLQRETNPIWQREAILSGRH